MSTVVVAEKPSVARDIARVLGARKKGEGYLEGHGYVVTWALGHLVQFAEPDDYGPPWNEAWQREALPMLPETWKLKTVRATASQFRVVRALLRDPKHEQIICATDAGREGEHIFRLIYEQAHCHKPVQRLWISSLTDHAIRQGLRQLRPSADFDALAQAAWVRAQADWLVGMNLTRAYTVHNGVLCTIGRVQTPTLAMVVARDAAIARFTRAFFYELVAGLQEGFSARYSRDGQTRIEAKEDAQRLHARLAPCKTGTVTDIEKKIVRHRPPSLYNLTDLQRDTNRRFGMTAAQVLAGAQALYDTHKLITYPRTESRHLPRDMVEHLPGILSGLSHPQAPVALERLRQGHRLNPAYVDDAKLTDHHAIVPTGQKPSPTLSPALRQLYDLVVTRFVAIFLPHEVVEETTVTLDIGGEPFIATGSVELEAGWRLVAPRRQDGEPSERQVIPPLEQGQPVHVETLEVVEKATEPPRPYTDATLLAAMKYAGRALEDEALAEAMQASGLGTPATRAETIERLIRSAYVRREGKALRATAKGQALIAVVAEPLRSPQLTARWEQRLQDIEEQRDSAQAFYQAIVEWVRTWTPQVAAGAVLSPGQVSGTDGQGLSPPGHAGLGTCPKCHQGVIVENARAYGCSRYREGCTLTIWKVVAKKKLTPKQVQTLLTRGATGPLKGFKSQAGHPFTARLRWDPSFKVVFDCEPSPEPRSAPQAARAPAAEPAALTCPKCSQGRVIEGKKGYGCTRYREGCNFVVWKEMAHKTLSDRQRTSLIRTGRTGVIKGFQSRSGRRFAARLKLDDACQVVFDFR